MRSAPASDHVLVAAVEESLLAVAVQLELLGVVVVVVVGERTLVQAVVAQLQVEEVAQLQLVVVAAVEGRAM